MANKDLEWTVRNIVEPTLKLRKDWISIGTKEHECPPKVDGHIYQDTGKMPSGCLECYKALIFWEGHYSTENTARFIEMIQSFNFPYLGKFCEGVAVFYFTNPIETQNFADLLKGKMKEYNVEGKVDWQRACEAYRRARPDLWKDNKTFLGPIEPSDNWHR